MTIDDAIRNCEKVAEELEEEAVKGCCDDTEIMNKYTECAAEYRQIMEWLTELKQYQENTAKIIEQLDDEAEFAYADFDLYKYQVLGVDDADDLPDDDFRYGLRRAIEIIRSVGRNE